MRATSLKEDVQRWKTIGDGQFRVRFCVVLSFFFFLFYKFLFAHFVSPFFSRCARARARVVALLSRRSAVMNKNKRERHELLNRATATVRRAMREL
jgi:hypothetical protein